MPRPVPVTAFRPGGIMKKHTLVKIIAFALYVAIFAGSVLMLPQAAQAQDEGRFLGAGQINGDGSDSGLDGPPGALDTGRYTNDQTYNNEASAGIIQGDGFSVNLTNPQTHGHDDDVGARAGWSWEF